MKSALSLLVLALLTTGQPSAAEVRKSITLDQVSLDAQGNFVSCHLADGSELVATTWMLSLGNEILAKSEPAAFESTTAQYLDFKSKRYAASVMKQDCKSGGKQGVGLQILRGPNKGKTESHLCVENLPCH